MRKKLLTFALATTMVVSTALTASAADKISGDLTVTTFFTEKTDFVPFKDGADYTFKFKNTSNGTNNWENYVLCVTSASSADKKGAAEDEALVIRADNWGWGGSLSDFVAPDQTGNPLTFTTDITDWSTWPTEMAAGVDCVVNIARSGNKITYSATVGTHKFSMEATSGVDLPADLYLFFTGENCNLTGFSTTVNTAGTTTASTTFRARLRLAFGRACANRSFGVSELRGADVDQTPFERFANRRVRVRALRVALSKDGSPRAARQSHGSRRRRVRRLPVAQSL